MEQDDFDWKPVNTPLGLAYERKIGGMVQILHPELYEQMMAYQNRQANPPIEDAASPEAGEPSDDAKTLADVNRLLASMLPGGRLPLFVHSAARMRPILLVAKQMLEARRASHGSPEIASELQPGTYVAKPSGDKIRIAEDGTVTVTPIPRS